MMISRLALLMVAATALTACDGGGDPVQQALRETSEKNQNAAFEASNGDHGAHQASAGDQTFAAAEAEMHTRMGAASGATVDEAYVAKMIEHHRGAIAMAQTALQSSRDPEIRRMALAVIDTQSREVAEMEAWKPSAATPAPPAG